MLDVDDMDPWSRHHEAMPVRAFLGGAALDDPDEPEGDDDELAGHGGHRRSAARVAGLLNEQASAALSWGEVALLQRECRYVDPRLTQFLGDLPQVMWLVFYCCSDHIVTVARHPERRQWRVYPGLALPFDYDLDALDDLTDDADDAPVIDLRSDEEPEGHVEPESPSIPDRLEWIPVAAACGQLGLGVGDGLELMKSLDARVVDGVRHVRAADVDDLCDRIAREVEAGLLAAPSSGPDPIAAHPLDSDQILVLAELIRSRGWQQRGRLRRRAGLGRRRAAHAIRCLAVAGLAETKRDGKRVRAVGDVDRVLRSAVAVDGFHR